MSGCIEKTETSQTGMANVQLAEDSPTQLQVDFDADVSSNLFRVRGSLMFAGNSSYPYLLLNATLRQGNKAIQSTKFLFIQTRPSDDLSFEISKNMKIPCGRYNCTLEVVGPGGLLDCETRECGLAEPWEETTHPASSTPSEKLATKTAEQLYQEFVSQQEDAKGGEIAVDRKDGMTREMSAADRTDDRTDDDISSVSSEDAVMEENSPDVKVAPDLDNGSSEQSGTKQNLSSSVSIRQDGLFVGSVTSKKYHRPDCRYALKIKPENRIYFDSVEGARSQGYLPCKTCNP
ncbi:MAG: Metal binding domain of Ada [Methanosaeta sp. PtaU1.Bin016]|nr:MAG: Metal binding domain of Ada [Methanosaeta sp. PtaU1.Bin016]